MHEFLVNLLQVTWNETESCLFPVTNIMFVNDFPTPPVLKLSKDINTVFSQAITGRQDT